VFVNRSIEIDYYAEIARNHICIIMMGTGLIPKERVKEIVLEVFDLTPAAIIEHLDLLRPIYRKTAAYGHFGRTEPEFTWENTQMSGLLREKAGI
jgi:S-adenosylmethionine synthetase